MTCPAQRRGAVALLAGLALVAGAAAAPPASAEGPEQVVNGDFSDGLNGWNAYPSASVVDGRGCIDVPAGTGAYSAAITQIVPMVEGETYALRFSALASPGLSSTVRAVIQAGPEQNYAQALPEKVLTLGPDLELSHLIDDRYDAVIAQDHVLAKRRRIQLADLAREPWIAGTPSCGCREITDRACQDAGFDLSVAFEADETMAAQALVAAGVGVTIFPRLALNPLHPGVVARSLGSAAPVRRIWAARLVDGYRSPACEAMLQILEDVAEEFREQPSSLAAVS